MTTVFPISCLGSCYSKTSSHELCCSIQSLFLSCASPAQIVLVVDGPIEDALSATINRLENIYESLNVLRIESNVGLGKALKMGLQICSYDLVFRFDTDDINLSSRLPVQYHFMTANPDVCCCGSDVLEFRRDARHSYVRLKSMPKRFYFFCGLFRNPLNHPTVAFRRHYVQKAGGYLDCNFFEDYSLWIRLMIRGFRIANLSSPPLVCMDRPDIRTRRSGKSYFFDELSFAFSLPRYGLAAVPFLFSISIRALFRYIFSALIRSTPWRSSWIVMDSKHLSGISFNDFEAIKQRFHL